MTLTMIANDTQFCQKKCIGSHTGTVGGRQLLSQLNVMAPMKRFCWHSRQMSLVSFISLLKQNNPLCSTFEQFKRKRKRKMKMKTKMKTNQSVMVVRLTEKSDHC